MGSVRLRQFHFWSTGIAFCALLALALPLAAGPKVVSGKLRAIRSNHLTVQKSNLFGASNVEVDIDSKTKIHGQLVQGMHVRIRYREEKPEDAAVHPGGEKAGPRRIATEIDAWPELATKRERKAAKDSGP